MLGFCLAHGRSLGARVECLVRHNLLPETTEAVFRRQTEAHRPGPPEGADMLILSSTAGVSSSSAFVLVALCLAVPHLIVEFIQIRDLYRARRSLTPAPDVMPGNCYYKFYHPNEVRPRHTLLQEP